MTRTAMRTAGLWIEQGHILLESLADRDLWGIPGGTLEPKESVEEGCVREYREETGIKMHVSGLALLHENFWQDDDSYVREYCFYFRVRPEDPSRRSLTPVVSREPQLKFSWFPLEEIGSLEFVPVSLQSVLPRLGDQTLFVSTREAP